MFYSTLLEEDIMDGIVQDPDEPGVDLNAVEKAIAGEDGIAAHQDEVEDAVEGMIDDNPVSEFAMIMYESEYNYNQIMEAIGMTELHEAAMGRELVLEAVDIKGFFRKIKEFFVNMFERITEVVHKVLAKFDFQAKADKKFVTQNAALIKDGESNTNVKIEGYLITKNLVKEFDYVVMDDREIDFKNFNMQKFLEAIKSTNPSAEVLDNLIKSVKEVSKDEIFFTAALEGVEAKNMKEFKAKYHSRLFGDKKMLTSSDISAQNVIDLLKAERETTAIRKAYSEVKRKYKEILNDINRFQQNASKTSDKLTNKYIAVCQAYTNMAKKTRSLSNVIYSECISAARYKRNLYRKFAHEYAKNSQGKGKYKPANESGSFFDMISMN